MNTNSTLAQSERTKTLIILKSIPEVRRGNYEFSSRMAYYISIGGKPEDIYGFQEVEDE